MLYSDKGYDANEIPSEQEKRAIIDALLILSLGNIEPNKKYTVQFYEKELKAGEWGDYYSARIKVDIQEGK